MRSYRYIVFVLVIFILFGSTNSCSTKQKVAITPQNKILFTAKQSGVMNIVKIDLMTKIKKVISTVPYCPVDVYGSGENGFQLSPDKKKFAFQVIRKIKDVSLYDIYTMNLDGTELNQVTKEINFLNNNNKEDFSLKFSFSPDSQFIIICSYFRNKEEDKIVKMKLYVASINGTNVEEFEEDNPLIHIYFFFLFSENKNLETIKSDATGFEYFISYEKSIGIFSWKTRKYSPIFKFNETIASCLPSLDQKHILFKVYKPKPHLEALYDYNVALKSATKLIESSTTITNMLWLWNNEQMLFAKETGGVSIHNIKPAEIYLLDIPTLKSELICGSGQIVSMNYQYDKKIKVTGISVDGGFFQLINMETKKEEDTPLFGGFNTFINKTDYIDFNNEGFSIYDTKVKVKKAEKKEWSYDDNMRINSFKISPDETKFYFASDYEIYIYDSSGNKLLVQRLSNVGYPYQCSYLTGLFTSPNEIVYLEFSNYKTDLYQYDLTTNKSTNLTDKLNEVELYQTSPDQKQVAVLSMKWDKRQFYLDLVDLTANSQIKRVTSFPDPSRIEDTIAPFDRDDKSHLYPIFWSLNSKILYFVSAGLHEEINSRIFNKLTINQVKVDDLKIEALTPTVGISFQPNLSPDGKKLVCVSGHRLNVLLLNEEKKENNKKTEIITVEELAKFFMNATDAEKWRISYSGIDPYWIHPTWSKDGKLIAFYQNTGIYQKNRDKLSYNFTIINQKKEIVKTIPITIPYPERLIDQLKNLDNFSLDGKFIVIIKGLQQEPFQSTLTLLKDLKEEIPLQGNNIDFRWSPIGNQLLLLESKTKNQINQLILYDCSTNSYAPISQDVQQLFDACWSPDGKQILYAGTDNKTGQIVFKTSQADGSNQKVLFTFGENPLERPSSIEKIEKLVWLK